MPLGMVSARGLVNPEEAVVGVNPEEAVVGVGGICPLDYFFSVESKKMYFVVFIGIGSGTDTGDLADQVIVIFNVCRIFVWLLLNFQSGRFESSAAHIAAILGRVSIVIGLVLVEIFDIQRRPVLSVGDLGK